MSFFTRGGSDSESDSDESVVAQPTKQQRPPVSRFLAGGSDDSDSDSDSDSSDSESSDEEAMSDGSQAARQVRANAFMHDADSSDDDSDDAKVVLMSAKDKRFAEMDGAIHGITNSTKTSDWTAVSNDFDKLLRFIQRHQATVSASAIPPAGHIPPAFLGAITELDETVNATVASEKSAKKKMNASKAKALNGMKQKLKKTLKEFENAVKAYTNDKDAYTAAYNAAVAGPAAATSAAERKAKKAAAAEAGEEPQDAGDFMTIGKGGKALNLTTDGVFKTLREVLEQRGRKNTDRAETIKILSKLLEVSVTTYQKIRVLLTLISARLDYSQNLPSIPHESWVAGLGELTQLVELLLAEPDYVVQGDVEEYDDQIERAPEVVDGKTVRVTVRGSVISLVENLDNEFTKTLQHTDAHERGSEYVERLREETPLYALLLKAQVLFEREHWVEEASRVVMRRLEHLYSKPDAIVHHLDSTAVKALPGARSTITPLDASHDASDLVHQLCVHLYRSDTSLLRTRAILAHIYHHAMHGRYHEARDLLLMSHLQDSISHADVTTQILYNRAVVQLGLAAFRRGYISECQTILADMFSSQRQKELLAQGVQRYNNLLSPEQELLEKRRLLPFHLHVNIELLEAAYLVSCMLVEIPLLASVDTDEQRRRIASKSFKRLLDIADKQAFMGPPENTRDHITKASKALQAGEWEKARDLVLSIKVWALLDNVADVKEMLARKIQEEGLRTYLFTYAPYYASLSLAHLAATFSLSISAVTSIVSKMIYTDELEAALDQIDAVVIFHRVEQSTVQHLAQQLAEKAVAMVEQNEKTLDLKLGAGPGGDRGDARAGGEGARGRGERRGGGRGTLRGRGRGRGGFNSGLGGRRVAA